VGKGLKGKLSAYKPKGDNFFTDMLKLIGWARTRSKKSGKGGKALRWLSKEIRRE